MTASDQASLWGALHRLRQLAERDYGGGGLLVVAAPWQRRLAYAHAASGGARTLDDVDASDVDCANFAVTIENASGSTSANVCMLRLAEGQWHVSGYRVGARQLLGVEHPTTAD